MRKDVKSRGMAHATLFIGYHYYSARHRHGHLSRSCYFICANRRRDGKKGREMGREGIEGGRLSA